jgi:phosphoesterase RecJ-like protein
MDQIIERLNSCQDVLVVSHVNPDGDAVGSLVAFGCAMETMNKKRVTLYNESPIPAVYRFLSGVGKIRNQAGCVSEYDTAVVLDCGDLSRVGKIHTHVSKIPAVINIDHHITNTGFGTHRLIDTGACATTELVYRIMKKMGLRFDTCIATSIYTGILTDTGSFRFSNTNRETFSICEEMTEYGVDPYQVAQHVYGTYSLGRIKLLNMALDSIEVSCDGKMSVMTVPREMIEETGTNPQDIDGMINYAKGIEDVIVAALILEHEKGTSEYKFHVSLRSDGTVDVADIASRFGGGGHSSAAGFCVDLSLAEIKSKILNLGPVIQ